MLQSLDPNVLTISLSRWMSLPGLDLRHWEMLVEAEKQRKFLGNRGDSFSLIQEKISTCKPATRVSIGVVAAYYRDYVTRQGLEKYFRWLVQHKKNEIFRHYLSQKVSFY